MIFIWSNANRYAISYQHGADRLENVDTALSDDSGQSRSCASMFLTRDERGQDTAGPARCLARSFDQHRWLFGSVNRLFRLGWKLAARMFGRESTGWEDGDIATLPVPLRISWDNWSRSVGVILSRRAGS